MREEENIAGCLIRVDEIVNIVEGLGEEVDDKVIVQNVFRSLTMRCDAIVSSIKDREHLDKLTMDELHGILIAYAMKIRHQEASKREATFKASKETKNHEKMPNKIPYNESYEEEANFLRKLKKGTSKYKGKIQLKCSLPMQNDSDDEK